MNNYMIQVVTCTGDLEDAILGDEMAGEDLEDQVRMDHAYEIQAPMLTPQQPSFSMLSKVSSKTNLTSQSVVHKRNDASTRLDAAYR